VRFDVEQRFSADLATVEAVLYSPPLLERLATLPKLGGATLLSEQRDGARITRRVRYRFTAELNAAVTAVVDPDKLTWVEESVHDTTTHRTTWGIVPDHYPGRMTCQGTFQLLADGSGTRRLTQAELKVHVPIVGGRVERAIVSGLEEHAVDEEQAVNAYLSTL
jgi:hypothetical protein